MFSRRVMATASVATLTALALSGCVSFIDVADSNGVGECSGKGSVSLSVTQNTPGDAITIDYQGPSDVTLAATQGFYSENNFYDEIPTRLMSFGVSDSNSATFINVLNTDIGWTNTTTAPGFVHAHYEGTVNDFVGQFTYSGGTQSGADPIIDRFVPFAIGVSCDSELVSGAYTNFDADISMLSTDVAFAVAQPVFPNHVITDAMEIVSQEPTTDGVQGTIRFPAGTEAALGDFHALQTEGSLYVYAVLDNPDVPNNTMSDLWFQALSGSNDTNNSFTITAPYSFTEPMSFTFTNIVDHVLTEGDYILFFEINGTDGDGNSAGKFLFAAAHYSEDGGLDVTDVSVPLSGEVEPTPPAKLAETGVGADTLVLGGFAAVILVAGAAMFIVRRRRA